jgi:adenine-specific DNA-methyltransferase
MSAETALDSAAELPDRLDLRSDDLAAERLAELLRLFPEVATEGGKLDFDQLKRALGEQVEAGKERYGMTWPGKADCFKAIQTPSTGTLLPCPEESVNFDSTENLIIEGDNLEVLKLLQKSYLGRVKMIYIDPPYNTGNDFIYPDNYTESLQTYLEYTGQVDSGGKKFTTNTESEGRFHSKWLNMMYPRIYLARNLLTEDGVMFVSIDDREVDNVKKICNEVFGEENFIGFACRVAKKTNNKGDYWAPNFDYIATYARNIALTTPFFGGVNLAAYDQADAEGPRKGDKYQLVRLYMSNIQNRNPEQRYFVECPDGTKVIPPGKTLPPVRPLLGDGIWRWTRRKFDDERDKIVIKQVRTSNLIDEHGAPAKWNVYTKTYLDDVIANSSAKPNSLLEGFINQVGSEELRELDIPFDYPKPSPLIKHLLEIAQCRDSDIVLDFFAGSGTTGHAVLNLNNEDGGKRRFILVQLPEPTGRDDFATVADICKERIRRVIGKLNSGDAGKLALLERGGMDRGFRVFKLSESNFTTWDAQGPEDTEALEQRLELHVEHIREGRTEDDLLYEILLKSGFPLATTVETVELVGKRVYVVADGALLLCLDRELNLELIRKIAEKGPERVVCLDAGFAGNDQLKANAVQLFKTKGIASFKTV